MSDDILLQVHKPARYIGQEWNVSRKDFDKAEIKFALCFPDLYEVGMSNLGIRIIYGLLNSIPDIICERFFACETDLETILRNSSTKITSLESKRILEEFDIVGFSLGSELGYTNVLNILDLGGIPLEASSRNENHPLIIGGGPCALNPEPMHEFFDLYVIGEAEEVILEILEIYRANKTKYRASTISKQDLLLLFSQIEGVYAPSLYKTEYNSDGSIIEFKRLIDGVPQKIKKRWVKDLNTSYFPQEWLVPYIQIIHDRITLEIMRGCPNRCSFCQSRAQYFPFRQREVENVLNLAQQSYESSGYEEISLCGLSVSDYTQIEKLIIELTDMFKEKAVSLSLPSIKAKALVGNLSTVIARTKKTGLTFAPEAGSQRLRDILHKDFLEEEFFEALKKSYLAGYQHVKLYFMIGLPFEEDSDLDGIIDFALRVSNLRKEVKGAPAQVNISINTLIPKPHTALQRLNMQEPGQIKNKQDYLRKRLRSKRIKLDFHNLQMSVLEGVLSRGDRRLSQVILSAFKKGARFDAWGNHFDFRIWQEAFNECSLDTGFYLRQKPQEEILPWDFFDVGMANKYLLDEFNKPVVI